MLLRQRSQDDTMATQNWQEQHSKLYQAFKSRTLLSDPKALSIPSQTQTVTRTRFPQGVSEIAQGFLRLSCLGLRVRCRFVCTVFLADPGLNNHLLSAERIPIPMRSFLVATKGLRKFPSQYASCQPRRHPNTGVHIHPRG